jgi:ABC-2 type transport system permease protein
VSREGRWPDPFPGNRHRGWIQFKTLIWLRWRILKNQMAKTGRLNFILMMIIIWACLTLAGLSFFIALGLGIALLPSITPLIALVVWDALIVAFCLIWLIGLLTELQRAEFLSIIKLLQLPMSFKGAFILNYLTSLASLSVLGFVPAALGLGLAFSIVHGPLFLLQIPAALSLVFMVSSVSYLLRAWLEAIMQNERKRRTVVVLMSLTIVALAQVPNLIIQTSVDIDHAPRAEYRERLVALQQRMEQGEIDTEAYQQAQDALNEERKVQIEAARQANFERWEQFLQTANAWIPLGWPALISKRLMESDVSTFVAGCLGLLAIGTGALGLSYHTSMRALTKADQPARQPRASASQATDQRRSHWLQLELPMVRAQPAAVQLATTVNLMRTPEAKMALVGPIVMVLLLLTIFMFRKTAITIPTGFEPYLYLAAVGMIFLGGLFYCMNMFGMDRNSFKSLVLMPVPRQDILLGKNLAIFPMAMLIAVPTLLGLCYFVPTTLITFIATLLQVVVIYIGTCLIANPISIWFPLPINPGSGQPAKMNFKVFLMQMLGMMGCTLLFVPACVAIGLEAMLWRVWEINFLPVYLLVGILELVGVVAVYRWGIIHQGAMLQQRETWIIEALKVGEE